MSKRKISLVILAIFLTSTASAVNVVRWNDPTTTYMDPSKERIDVFVGDNENPESTAPDLKAKICGSELIPLVTETNENNNLVYKANAKSVYEACGIGDYNDWRIYDEDNNFLKKGGGLEINARGMEPHRGKRLYLGINTDAGKLRHFFLTDDGSISLGSAMLAQHNPQDVLSPTWVREEVGTFTDPGILTGEDSFGTILPQESPSKEETARVAAEGFSDSTQLDFRFYGSLESMTPLHESGSYTLDGQLIRAKSVPSVNDDSKWFICRQGATMKDNTGGKTSQVVISGGERYKCSGEQWNKVEECGDGLDNDGDGSIDINDPGCEGTNTGSESGGQCEPFIGQRRVESPNSDNPVLKKTAYFDGTVTSDSQSADPLGRGCSYSYETVDELSVEDPKTFKCFSDGTASENTNVVGASDFCQRLKSIGVGTQTVPEYFHGADDSVKSVKYYVSPSAIPYSPEADSDDAPSTWSVTSTSSDASNFVRDTDDLEPNTPRKQCADTEGGFSYKRCETVHHAEDEYTDNLHHATLWEEKGLAEIANDGYTSEIQSNYPDYSQSWTVANTGGVGNNNVNPSFSGGRDITAPGVFNGGFAGKCSSGDWSFNQPQIPTGSGYWNCSQSSSNQFEIEATFYEMNGVNDLSNKYVGFHIGWNQLQKWYKAYPNSPDITDGGQRVEGGANRGVLEVRAQCWQGTRSQIPDDFDNIVNMTAQPLAENRPVYVIGKVPDNPKATSISDERRYTCLWGFRQFVDEADKIMAGDVYVEDSDGNVQKVSGDTSGFIIEGQSRDGRIKSASTTVSLVETRDNVIADPPEDSDKITPQQWLENHRQNQQRPNDAFKHFPGDEQDTFSNPSSDIVRNPWAYFERFILN